jgi:hypothetical protein
VTHESKRVLIRATASAIGGSKPSTSRAWVMAFGEG